MSFGMDSTVPAGGIPAPILDGIGMSGTDMKGGTSP